MRTLAIIVKINFYRTLEINQKLAIIWGAFIQEKWLNLNKNIKVCDILNGRVSSSLSQTPCRTWEPTTSKSGLPWPITLYLPQSSVPRNLSLSNLFGRSLETQSMGKTPTHRACLYLTWLRVLSLWIALSTGHFWKTTSDSRLASE